MGIDVSLNVLGLHQIVIIGSTCVLQRTYAKRDWNEAMLFVDVVVVKTAGPNVQ